MVGAPNADRSAPAAAGRLVTIKPDFATNRPPLHYCPGGPSSCRDVPPQPTNFVFLRTEPRGDAPLLSDPYLNNGGPGTDDIADWSDKAVTGRRYVLAERRGDWAGIWYGGKVGWLHDPGGVNTRPTAGIAVRPRAGRSTIPAYALAFPEPGEYPAGVPAESPPQDLVPLYQVPAGQRYALVDLHPATNYYARFDGANVPHNHTIIRGRETYLLVSFNHRYLFVRASDVEPC
jgi:hypothetical protein